MHNESHILRHNPLTVRVPSLSASLRPRSAPGFTILFASLVSSLLLAVGLVIFDITYKQAVFSAVVRDSNFAIYAADSGLECALYWDLRYTGSANYGSGSVFATSTDSTPPSSGVICNTQDIAAAGVTAGTWPTSKTATAATTTFTVSFPPQPYCSVVTVGKYPGAGTAVNTSVTAAGFNTCTAGAANRIERTLQANY